LPPVFSDSDTPPAAKTRIGRLHGRRYNVVMVRVEHVLDSWKTIWQDTAVAVTAQLAAQPAEFFSRIVTRMDGQKVTRLEMVETIKEHELTHRAQLFLYLRLKGLVPATTRRRLAKQAGK
jgi:uncharacterized damage-inducible protein DinB